jgi:hypothetical protein
MKKTIAIISASPKTGEQSVSRWLSDRAEVLLRDDNLDLLRIDVRQSLLKKQR